MRQKAYLVSVCEEFFILPYSFQRRQINSYRRYESIVCCTSKKFYSFLDSMILTRNYRASDEVKLFGTNHFLQNAFWRA